MDKIYILLAQENFKAFEVLGVFKFKAQAKEAKDYAKKQFTYNEFLILEKTIGELASDSYDTDIYEIFN